VRLARSTRQRPASVEKDQTEALSVPETNANFEGFANASLWLSIWFVTWVRHETGLRCARANAWSPVASISTAKMLRAAPLDRGSALAEWRIAADTA
jgi:hypothetical protein